MSTARLQHQHIRHCVQFSIIEEPYQHIDDILFRWCGRANLPNVMVDAIATVHIVKRSLVKVQVALGSGVEGKTKTRHLVETALLAVFQRGSLHFNSAISKLVLQLSEVSTCG